jgi:hypothetical protein
VFDKPPIEEIAMWDMLLEALGFPRGGGWY